MNDAVAQILTLEQHEEHENKHYCPRPERTEHGADDTLNHFDEAGGGLNNLYLANVLLVGGGRPIGPGSVAFRGRLGRLGLKFLDGVSRPADDPLATGALFDGVDAMSDVVLVFRQLFGQIDQLVDHQPANPNDDRQR